MKIIVVSDTHGSSRGFLKVMKLHKNADIVVHCGDSRDELDTVKRLYPMIRFYTVKGNCDFGSSLPVVEEFCVDGVRFMATHGHIYNVKYGLFDIDRAAREKKVDVVLYGHTHVAMDVVRDGIRFFNPGSLGFGGTFGVIEVKDGQVLSSIARL
ncbi:MAG: metallophosphoesterase [Ruminococcus sp.]|nr:metallophosphoesterase [Ruminococcus sp.]